MNKEEIVNKIKKDEQEYLSNLINDIIEINKITGPIPVFTEELSKKRNKKFNEYNTNLIDKKTGIKFRPDNSTINKWGEAPKYWAGGPDAKKIGPKKGYGIHIYTWMRSRDSQVPPGWEIHHKDGNHFNNTPENLICVPKSIHILLDMRSKEIKRTRKLSEKENEIVNTLYEMDMS